MRESGRAASGHEKAERQGFEPWIGVAYTHFPGVRLQPLGHLSVSEPLK